MNRSESKERWKNMAQMVAKGHSVGIVAAEFQVHGLTVIRACKIEGVMIPRQAQHPSTASRGSQFAILGMLFDESMSIKEIMEELGTTRTRIYQVYSLAKDCGVPVPDRADFKRKF